MNRSIFLLIALALAVPASAQTPTDFEQANARAEAQLAAQPEAMAVYAATWAEFNNAHGLDERDGCYFKAEGTLTQILEIDASGEIVGYLADKDNGRSRCWRATYVGEVFPKPPFAPYLHKLVMH
ncbi:hypothetical protein [Arenimonas alkanexedens]